MKYVFSFLAALIFVTISCRNKADHLSQYQQFNDSLRKTYAPDKRTAIYDIEIKFKEDSYLLTGETNLPKAKEPLLARLVGNNDVFIDSTTVLPDQSVGDLKYAVVNNAVANIRSQPKHSGELATQALLGTTLKVLKIKGDFYRVQTPDQYISWVDHGGVQLMTEKDYAIWFASDKIIYTKTNGFVYQNKNPNAARISDIVLGAQLQLISQDKTYYFVRYPDGRTGYVLKKEATSYKTWIQQLKPSQLLVEEYAKSLMGLPYLWGGTSTKGVDCSGFTKTVYLMNGLIIPRDASQQINAGLNVDTDLSYTNLEKGDLMFFGTKARNGNKQKVTHVGIWLGNGKGEFIHASKRVRLSSIYPDSPYYDKVNTDRYLGSRRYLGIKDPLITNLKEFESVENITP